MAKPALRISSAQVKAEHEKHCIILGAGAPHFGQTPALLHEPVRGLRVVEWILDALGTSTEHSTLIVGYKAAEIELRYPGLRLIHNAAWDKTGSVMSLLEAPLPAGHDLYVCYGDILFRKELVEALEKVDAPIVVAWDSSWRQGHRRASRQPLEAREKVLVSTGGVVRRLGNEIPTDWAHGEFIGLVRFSAEAVAKLEALRKAVPASLRQRHLSGLIEWLRGSGLDVAGVDAAGHWVEVNVPADIARFVLGTKAETLRRLRQLMTSATIFDQVAFTVAAWQKEAPKITDEIRKRFGASKVAVRSSARSEDSFHGSNAGAYTSLLNIDPWRELTAAVDTVIASYGTASPEDQVLVQPMATGVALCGVAFTRTLEHGAPYYVINFDESGATHHITDGSSGDSQTVLLQRGAPPEMAADPRLVPLIKALREIEELLGFDALDVEFAIDRAGRVYVLQVRPIAVRHDDLTHLDATCADAIGHARETWRRLEKAAPHLPAGKPVYGVMPDWNPAEIIGSAPGRLAETLYRYLILDEVWATQRAEYGYRDVRPQPLLVDFAGRPYVDVRASFASFLPASLDDALAAKLLGYYLERLRANPLLHDKVEFEVVPTCLSFAFDNWRRRLRGAGFRDDEITRLRNGLMALTAKGMQRTAQDRAQVERLMHRFEKLRNDTSLAPLDRARLLLDDCRRLGTLPFAHLARGGFVAVTLLRDAEAEGVMSPSAHTSFFSTVRTVSHELVEDAVNVSEGRLDWDTYVSRYGHLRPGTYDITSPCYAADPERYLRPLVDQAGKGKHEPPNPAGWEQERPRFFAALAALGLPAEPALTERFLYEAIEGREWAKFIFTRNLSGALEALATYGESLGIDRETLAHVPLDTLLQPRDRIANADAERARLLAAAAEGRQTQTTARHCEFPPLVTSELDFLTFVRRSERPNFVGSARITASSLALPPGGQAAGIAGSIVLIPHADPGYDWVFGHGIAGLITMYGGANSHMAIRAAEFGLSAAIGVGEQHYARLTRAALLELDPANGTIRVLR